MVSSLNACFSTRGPGQLGSQRDFFLLKKCIYLANLSFDLFMNMCIIVLDDRRVRVLIHCLVVFF